MCLKPFNKLWPVLCVLSLGFVSVAHANTATRVAPKVTTTSQHKVKSRTSINPRVLALALKAHKKAQSKGVVKKPFVTIIDYSLPSTQRRLWVINASTQKVLHHTLVAHGSGSGGNKPQRFSDKEGSHQSSIGVFVTGSTYQGKHGLSLKLHGLERGINGNAERRHIVVHSAHYVSAGMAKSMGRIGRSWGCPALNPSVSRSVIQKIKGGSMMFSYYPDKHWLNSSRFLS